MANEHDRRYKKLFSHPVFVQELLEHFVHEDFIKELDFNSLERLDKSFITDDFKEKESDLIYKIQYQGKDVYIYLLLEFQSTVDKYMALRMLRYICEFYEYVVQTRVTSLPSVFPVLLYNGDAKWTAKKSIKELIENHIPGKYIPDFSYYPVLENELSKNTLLSIKKALSAVFYIENSSPEELRAELRKIFTLLETEQPEIIILFKKWFNNYLGYQDQEINEEFTNLEEVQEMFATKLKKYREKVFQEGMQQGMQQGIEQGIERGEANKAIETAKKMLSLHFSTADICAVTGLSEKELEQLKESE